MPNTQTAIRATRKQANKKIVNVRTKREVKTATRKHFIEKSDTSYSELQKQADMATKKGAIHPNKANRIKSKAAKLVSNS